MPTRFKTILWFPLLAIAVTHGATIVVDKPHSSVTIAVKSTIDSFVAQLQDYDASVTMAPRTEQVEAAVFRFRFSSIKTGNTDRDRDMNEWQQTNRFPDVVFTLAALEPAGGGRSVARGRLRFHGVERPMSFPITVKTTPQTITMRGDATIDTRDYGLPVIKKYFVLKVDPTVHVHFYLQGKLAGP